MWNNPMIAPFISLWVLKNMCVMCSSRQADSGASSERVIGFFRALALQGLWCPYWFGYKAVRPLSVPSQRDGVCEGKAITPSATNQEGGGEQEKVKETERERERSEWVRESSKWVLNLSPGTNLKLTFWHMKQEGKSHINTTRGAERLRPPCGDNF